MALIERFGGILGLPTSIEGGLIVEILLLTIPIWTGFLIGLLAGWAWRPSWWPSLLDRKKFDSLISKLVDFSLPSSSSSLGFPSIAALNMKFSSCSANVDHIRANDINSFSFQPTIGDANCSSSQKISEEHCELNEGDLRYLFELVEVKDGGPSWIQMMDRSTSTMSYRAWRRDPENGPPQYRTCSIFEDATPEMVRDFFWDDEFRMKWDNMLTYAKTLEESHTTGTMMVQWVRKFPFFCSDREYIIGRRIWESGRTYYCVTKGVPCSSVPRRDKPRRVDVYYSSLCIRPVESKRRTGEMTACEVLLFHHEDMGIPWEIAKLGVRQGMWGTVKKIDPGLRAYQKARASGEPLSGAASMAHITTKVSPQYLESLSSGGDDQSVNEVSVPEEREKGGMNVRKLLVFGGAAVIACSLDRGLLTKAVIFGVARRLGRIGGKL